MTSLHGHPLRPTPDISDTHQAKNAGSFMAAYQEAQAHNLKAAMGKAGDI